MSVVPVGMVGAAHVSHADVQPAVATKVVGASTLVTAFEGASPPSDVESVSEAQPDRASPAMSDNEKQIFFMETLGIALGRLIAA